LPAGGRRNIGGPCSTDRTPKKASAGLQRRAHARSARRLKRFIRTVALAGAAPTPAGEKNDELSLYLHRGKSGSPD
jgi:hypothetical protein